MNLSIIRNNGYERHLPDEMVMTLKRLKFHQKQPKNDKKRIFYHYAYHHHFNSPSIYQDEKINSDSLSRLGLTGETDFQKYLELQQRFAEELINKAIELAATKIHSRYKVDEQEYKKFIDKYIEAITLCKTEGSEYAKYYNIDDKERISTMYIVVELTFIILYSKHLREYVLTAAIHLSTYKKMVASKKMRFYCGRIETPVWYMITK